MKRVALGIVVGVLLWGLVRLVVEPWPEPPHYHANWAVFVDGQRLDLSDDRYMEAVASCAATDVVRAEERVHMHNNEDEVVHVHHTGVAWGHFFDNLGFDAGEDYLILDDRRLFAEGGRTLRYVVNGFVVPQVDRRLIKPGDRLLISYGGESEEAVLAEQFPRVPANAAEYDERDDPGGCAGAVDVGFWERVRRAFWG